ncbi:MAG TPA: TIGR03067 domain-containing protein [Lacipirellulaceae bacterium]|nr:TIGR03067 domain-containing protein [Lacipirellulaceae bacterium]
MRRHFLTALCSLALAIGFNTRHAWGQSLDGTWEIVSVTDNGRVVAPTDVLLNYAADGRVVISGQQVELVVPMTYQRKRLPFAVDATQSPMAFDLAGAEKTGGRGIFMADKDSLLLCLSSRNQGRPTSFASLPGSGNLLVTLRRAAANTPAAGQPNAAPTYQDDQLRQMLTGTWGHQDPDSIHYITLGGDGSVNTTDTWKDQFKQLFHQDVHSQGTWQVRDGVVTISLASSSDNERRGQTGSFRVRSITGSQLVAVDYDGSVRQEWKAPQ